MKITSVETFVVDAGWRPWLFVKVATDEGVVGYGECSDCWSPQPHGIVGTIKDLTPLLLGQDPRPYERRVWDLLYSTRQSPGGIAAKAIAGIECALVDIKAKSLGISVVELFGGPMRERIRLYWSHCGTTRARYAEYVGAPPINTLADIAELGREVVQRGFTALKTNVVIPREQSQAGFGELAGLGSEVRGTDQIVTAPLLRHIERLIGTFRDAVGPDVDINLDLNFLFKPESATRIAPGGRAVCAVVAGSGYVRSRRYPTDQRGDDNQDLHRREPVPPARVPAVLRATRGRRVHGGCAVERL